MLSRSDLTRRRHRPHRRSVWPPFLGLGFALCLLGTSHCLSADTTLRCPSDSAKAAVLEVEVVDEFPHAVDAYTQGLFFHDGKLIESTGQYGGSSLRRFAPGDVQPEMVQRLPDEFFAEGVAQAGTDIVLLTWRNGVAFRLRAEDWQPIRRYRVDGEGWGLTFDGDTFWMSDGSANLIRRDAKSFEPVGQPLQVCDAGQPVERLNELEFVRGFLFANVWYSDDILVISPRTGRVLLRLNLADLHRAQPATAEVLNGIAFDAIGGRLFVTGKYWPTLYEISLPSLDGLTESRK